MTSAEDISSLLTVSIRENINCKSKKFRGLSRIRSHDLGILGSLSTQLSHGCLFGQEQVPCSIHEAVFHLQPNKGLRVI